MDAIKKLAGIICMLLGAAVVVLMLKQAGTEIDLAVKNNKAVLDTKMFWYIIIPIFAPIMGGLLIFGYYALKGEYNEIPRDSAHL